MTVTKPKALKRLFTGGHNGFAEAYMDGALDIDDPAQLFHWFLVNERALAGSTRGRWLARAFDRLIHVLRPNSKRGSRKNIHAHYDLGNSFYQLWLDDSMTYSSAIFNEMDEALPDAQARKYRRIADMLDLAPGKSVLEIGCGWGGFLETAVLEYGADATGITISEEQFAFAQKRLAPSGQTDAVRFEDYRDTDGQFDAIASIEMFEAVGEANWPTYFQTVYDRLKPGGKALIQVITIEQERFHEYRKGADFIQRYIFPGGMLPSPERFETSAEAAGLMVADRFWFGPSYAETLRRWLADFEARWDTIEGLGFDDRFRRMWRYYLTYCEAGFDHGSIDVGQYLLEKPA